MWEKGKKRESRRRSETVKAEKDLPLQAEQRAENSSQGMEMVVLWDGNNPWVSDASLDTHLFIDLVEPGPTCD